MFVFDESVWFSKTPVKFKKAIRIVFVALWCGACLGQDETLAIFPPKDERSLYQYNGADWKFPRCIKKDGEWQGYCYQSPINISDCKVETRNPPGTDLSVAFWYSTELSRYKVVNTGRAIEVILNKGSNFGGITLDGNTYIAYKLQFHAPAEHTFMHHPTIIRKFAPEPPVIKSEEWWTWQFAASKCDTLLKRRPLEMQIFHRTIGVQEDSPAVIVSLTFEKQFLEALVNNKDNGLPMRRHSFGATEMTPFDLLKLVTAAGNVVYRYQGSPTSLSLEPKVQWVVFRDPVDARVSQLSLFQWIIVVGISEEHGNYRLTQNTLYTNGNVSPIYKTTATRRQRPPQRLNTQDEESNERDEEGSEYDG